MRTPIPVPAERGARLIPFISRNCVNHRASRFLWLTTWGRHFLMTTKLSISLEGQTAHPHFCMNYETSHHIWKAVFFSVSPKTVFFTVHHLTRVNFRHFIIFAFAFRSREQKTFHVVLPEAQIRMHMCSSTNQFFITNCKSLAHFLQMFLRNLVNAFSRGHPQNFLKKPCWKINKKSAILVLKQQF